MWGPHLGRDQQNPASHRGTSMATQTYAQSRTAQSDAIIARLNRLAWLLDSSVPIPGLKFRIGIDALIGLIPGIGDALGVLLSSYILREGARLGVPRSILVRMALN